MRSLPSSVVVLSLGVGVGSLLGVDRWRSCRSSQTGKLGNDMGVGVVSAIMSIVKYVERRSEYCCGVMLRGNRVSKAE